jgi:hypothetical protein
MKDFKNLSQQEKVKFLQDMAKDSAKQSAFLYSGIFAVVLIAIFLGSL